MANERALQDPDVQPIASVASASSPVTLSRPLWIWPFIAGVAVAVAAACVVLLATGVSKVTTVEVQVVEESTVEPDTPCEADKRAVEVAVEVWYANFGDAVNPSQSDLVRAGYLPTVVGTYEIRPAGSGVEVDPVVGGECA